MLQVTSSHHCGNLNTERELANEGASVALLDHGINDVILKVGFRYSIISLKQPLQRTAVFLFCIMVEEDC